MSAKEQAAAMRAAHRKELEESLRDGRKQRAAVVPPKKGRGSYRRSKRVDETD